MTTRIFQIIFSLVAVLVTASLAASQEDVRGVKLRVEGLKVIDEKCLACHNRQRIDEAVQERREINQILRRMEKKGVVLTEKEHLVMGHFWGQKVFKTKERAATP
jgi:hypothetical protein